MAEQIAPTVNGFAAARVLVTVPNKGPWSADCDVSSEAPITGRVTITLSPTLELKGTVVPEQSGTFAQTNWIRVVAGGAGWSESISARGYHNDAGVKTLAIAQDAATACGETIGGFAPSAERLGVDFARNFGRASSALEIAAGEVPWWVDYAGVTHVGLRPETELASEAYHVIGYNPRERMALIGADDPGLVTIGSVLSEHLDDPGAVRELQILADKTGVQLMCWLGGDERSPARLAAIMQSIVSRVSDRRLYGIYRYRVVRMAPDGRVDLQAARKAVGLPDLAPIDMWPGVPGVHSELSEGAEVLVQFIDGDKSQPIVTHYAAENADGFIPTQIVIGGTDGPEAGRKGDAVEVLLPPAVLTGTLTPPGSAITGVITFTSNKAEGQITAGSGKVKIA